MEGPGILRKVPIFFRSEAPALVSLPVYFLVYPSFGDNTIVQTKHLKENSLHKERHTIFFSGRSTKRGEEKPPDPLSKKNTFSLKVKNVQKNMKY